MSVHKRRRSIHLQKKAHFQSIKQNTKEMGNNRYDWVVNYRKTTDVFF